MEIRAVLPRENWQWSRVQSRPMSRASECVLRKRRKEDGPLMTVPGPTFTPGGNDSSFSMSMILPVSSASHSDGEQGKNHRLWNRLLVSAGGGDVAVCSLSAGAEAAGL